MDNNYTLKTKKKHSPMCPIGRLLLFYLLDGANSQSDTNFSHSLGKSQIKACMVNIFFMLFMWDSWVKIWSYIFSTYKRCVGFSKMHISPDFLVNYFLSRFIIILTFKFLRALIKRNNSKNSRVLHLRPFLNCM